MGGAVRPKTLLLSERYRLVEQLGAGGMSVVWRGYDEVLGRQVAVKVLASRLASDRTFRYRIRTEAQAAARLCHPHITNVYDYGESEQDGLTVPYVVMELVEGETLTGRLRRAGRLPWREAVTVGAEVASALATAHARGVVHRDVTPGNVMLTATGAKVVDFGISALVGESDTGPNGELLGTPAYLAPERLDRGHVTPATDVYALGLLLYRMLTGRLPWAAGTTTQMIRAHRYRDPEPMAEVRDLPDEVAELVRRCLAKRPAERPDSREVARTLAEAAGVLVPVPVSPAPGMNADAADPAELATLGTTILPRPTGTEAVSGPVTGTRTRRAERRRHGLQMAAVSAGLVGVTGAVWALTSGTPAGVGEKPAHAESAVQQPLPCQVRYALRKDSGRTFDADLTVTNTGVREVRDWALSFSFPGNQRVTAGRSVRWEQQGQTVTLRPAGAQAALAPGASRALTLIGRYASANPLPMEFRLGDATCGVQLSVAPAPSAPASTAAPAPTRTKASHDERRKPASEGREKGKEKGKGHGEGGHGKG